MNNRPLAGMMNEQEKAPGAAVIPPHVIAVLRSSGRPLDEPVRQEMNEAFQHDFSQVKIHTDAMSSESTKAISASAYTIGNHIVFSAGRYSPDSSYGRRLLSHELAHSIQQSNVSGRAINNITPLHNGFNLEREARQASNNVLLGRHPIVSSRLSSPVIQKEDDHATQQADLYNISIRYTNGEVLSYSNLNLSESKARLQQAHQTLHGIIQMGFEEHERMLNQLANSPHVASIVDMVGGTQFPSLGIWANSQRLLDGATRQIRNNNIASAANHLSLASDSAFRADNHLREYQRRRLSGAEISTTVLTGARAAGAIAAVIVLPAAAGVGLVGSAGLAALGTGIFEAASQGGQVVEGERSSIDLAEVGRESLITLVSILLTGGLFRAIEWLARSNFARPIIELIGRLLRPLSAVFNRVLPRSFFSRTLRQLPDRARQLTLENVRNAVHDTLAGISFTVIEQVVRATNLFTRWPSRHEWGDRARRLGEALSLYDLIWFAFLGKIARSSHELAGNRRAARAQENSQDRQSADRVTTEDATLQQQSENSQGRQGTDRATTLERFQQRYRSLRFVGEMMRGVDNAIPARVGAPGGPSQAEVLQVEATPESVAEVTPELVTETTPEAVVEVTPEPVAEGSPEPVAEVTPEPIVELNPESITENVTLQQQPENSQSQLGVDNATLVVIGEPSSLSHEETLLAENSQNESANAGNEQMVTNTNIAQLKIETIPDITSAEILAINELTEESLDRVVHYAQTNHNIYSVKGKIVEELALNTPEVEQALSWAREQAVAEGIPEDRVRVVMGVRGQSPSQTSSGSFQELGDLVIVAENEGRLRIFVVLESKSRSNAVELSRRNSEELGQVGMDLERFQELPVRIEDSSQAQPDQTENNSYDYDPLQIDISRTRTRWIGIFPQGVRLGQRSLTRIRRGFPNFRQANVPVRDAILNEVAARIVEITSTNTEESSNVE